MGCNSSKGIEVGNGNNKEGWNNLPLMRSLSRSFSMPLGQSFKPASSSFDGLNGHGFHAVALTSSTYGVLRMADSSRHEKLYDEAASSKFGDDGPGEVIDPPLPSFKSFKPGSGHNKASERVREPDVIDVWELMEDLNENKEQEGPSVKRRRRTKAYSKSASLPHLHVAKSSCRFSGIENEGHGLPLVLEQSSSGSPRRVLPGSRLAKNEEASSGSGSGRPPLAPSSSSSLRKGLFYGASLSLKQDAIVERTNTTGRRISSAGNENGRRSSVEASGYCTPYENFGSPSELSCPGSPACSAIDDDGWCLVGGRRDVFVDARSSFRSTSGRDESFAAMNEAIAAAVVADGFQRDTTTKVKDAKKVLFSKVSPAAEVEVEEKKSLLDSFERKCPPGGEDRVVFYFTSLQGIRKTYEQCKSVRMVLEGFFTRIDERDVSMHSEFRQEVKKLVGSLPVPRLFIKGKYIGGAEEVLQLNENGLIGQLLEGIPKQILRKVCEGCGGMRFIPCMECSGSCKLVGDGNQVVRCLDCNENGLVRCPICY